MYDLISFAWIIWIYLWLKWISIVLYRPFSFVAPSTLKVILDCTFIMTSSLSNSKSLTDYYIIYFFMQGLSFFQNFNENKNKQDNWQNDSKHQEDVLTKLKKIIYSLTYIFFLIYLQFGRRKTVSFSKILVVNVEWAWDECSHSRSPLT